MSAKTAQFLVSFLSILTSSKQFEMTLVHTSEVYYTLTPTDIFNNLCVDDLNGCSGGVARLKSLIDSYRKKYKNVLVVDSGNFIEPNAWHDHFGPELLQEVRSSLGYDVMVPGLNELLLINESKRDPRLKPYLTCLNCEGNYKPYIIVTMEGVKVAVLGSISPRLQEWSIIKKVHARVLTPLLIKEILYTLNVSIIIALSFASVDETNHYAYRSQDIDVVVGGAKGGLLFNGLNPEPGLVTGPYPLLKKKKRGHTLLVHAGQYGKFIGRLTLTFDNLGKLTTWEGSMNHVNVFERRGQPIVFDNNLKKTFEKRLGKLGNMTDEIGNSLDFMDKDLCYLRDCPIAHILCEALIEYANGLLDAKMNDPRHVHLCLTLGYFIRRSIPAGPITWYQLSNLFSFNIEYASIEMLGIDIMNLFETPLKETKIRTYSGMTLLSLGLKFKFDQKRPSGSMIHDVKVWKCFKCKSYVPIKFWRRYRILVPVFFIRPGMIQHLFYIIPNVTDDDILIRGFTDFMAMAYHLKRKSPIFAPLAQHYDIRQATPAWIPEMLLSDKISHRIDYLSIFWASFVHCFFTLKKVD